MDVSATHQPDRLVPAAAAPPASRRAAPHEPAFAALYERAAAAVDRVTVKFIATALIYPLLEQISEGPFKSELFDGGFTQSAFRQRLNMRFADEIATNSRFAAGEVLGGRLREWVEHQSPATLRQADWIKGVNTIG